jgi:hypothetical protein
MAVESQIDQQPKNLILALVVRKRLSGVGAEGDVAWGRSVRACGWEWKILSGTCMRRCVAASVAEIYQTNRSTAFWGWCCHQWLKKSWIPRHNTRWPHDRHMHEIVAYVWRRLWLRFIKQIGQQLFEGDGVIIGWIKVNKSWTRRHNTRWPHDQVLVANNSKRKLEKASSLYHDTM